MVTDTTSGAGPGWARHAGQEYALCWRGQGQSEQRLLWRRHAEHLQLQPPAELAAFGRRQGAQAVAKARERFNLAHVCEMNRRVLPATGNGSDVAGARGAGGMTAAREPSAESGGLTAAASAAEDRAQRGAEHRRPGDGEAAGEHAPDGGGDGDGDGLGSSGALVTMAIHRLRRPCPGCRDGAVRSGAAAEQRSSGAPPLSLSSGGPRGPARLPGAAGAAGFGFGSDLFGPGTSHCLRLEGREGAFNVRREQRGDRLGQRADGECAPAGRPGPNRRHPEQSSCAPTAAADSALP